MHLTAIKRDFIKPERRNLPLGVIELFANSGIER